VEFCNLEAVDTGSTFLIGLSDLQFHLPRSDPVAEKTFHKPSSTCHQTSPKCTSKLLQFPSVHIAFGPHIVHAFIIITHDENIALPLWCLPPQVSEHTTPDCPDPSLFVMSLIGAVCSPASQAVMTSFIITLFF
jgi:hypothetical protein